MTLAEELWISVLTLVLLTTNHLKRSPPPHVCIVPDFPDRISPYRLGVFAGSIFVTCLAEGFLKSGFTSCFVLSPRSQKFAEKLKGSQYEGEAGLIADCFDKTTKHRFRSANEPAYIKFGTMRDTDARLDIRSGQLRLAG